MPSTSETGPQFNMKYVHTSHDVHKLIFYLYCSGKFATIMHNWHKTCDGRELTQEQRFQYTKDIQDYILVNWMPWHQNNKDHIVLLKKGKISVQ